MKNLTKREGRKLTPQNEEFNAIEQEKNPCGRLTS